MSSLFEIAKRIVYALSLVLAVIVFNFLLIHMAPGDPAEVIAGEMGGTTEEIVASIRQSYGLDQPLLTQLWLYLKQVAGGDLGYSYYFNRPVTDLILQRLPATLLLVISALLLAIIIGTALGVVSARRPRGFLSHFVTVLALVGFSAPVFWTGIMLLLLFASYLSFFPVGGMYSMTLEGGFGVKALDVLHHLVLPMATLSIIYVAQYSRLARASTLDVLGADYIRTARAKGLSEAVVVYKHALRNAVLPVVTIAGLQFSQLLSGAVLVETVFNWPGLGRLAFESILRRDYPTILGILFFSAFVVVIANLLTDLAYRLIDPRIKAGASS
ncbi:ABC transporter permease [Afifella sp. IM 167]|uniref:ABC transporter permease n=1 Tax=Afifella sp. IM 167 TaxID=2033586 RepID=UPI001CCC6A3F|nr:ABC transporter permease [Afifella sp. IM 167]MBZ8134459.1 ABC transporter permease [Afifella sp. IM 167]